MIIRTLNDHDRLIELMDALDRQNYAGEREVIVVDTSSVDGTPELARARGAKVVTIAPERFSYPYAINVGIAAAAGDLAVVTVGHAVPFSDSWLRSGVRHFADAGVAGAFGPPIARRDAPLVEKVFYLTGYLKARAFGPHDATPERWPGILGATNCIVRRSLWEEHPFDERYGKGGEDVAWARWAIAAGYRIICDPAFSVRHSHGNGLRQLLRQRRYWRSLDVPQPFSREELSFRTDLRWND